MGGKGKTEGVYGHVVLEGKERVGWRRERRRAGAAAEAQAAPPHLSPLSGRTLGGKRDNSTKQTTDKHLFILLCFPFSSFLLINLTAKLASKHHAGQCTPQCFQKDGGWPWLVGAVDGLLAPLHLQAALHEDHDEIEKGKNTTQKGTTCRSRIQIESVCGPLGSHACSAHRPPMAPRP